MAFTALSFSSGEVLTSSKMNLLMSNFKSFANQDATAPTITNIPRAWVNHDAAATMVGSQYNITSVSDWVLSLTPESIKSSLSLE